MMNAAVAEKAKQPWVVKKIPTPKAGPGQVLVQMKASGVCYTDIHQTEGDLGDIFPRVLGHEPVGEIVEVGAGVKHRKSGDRVGVLAFQDSCGRCEFCERDKGIFCNDVVYTSFQKDGGHAEFVVAEADETILLPETLPYEYAAPLLCAGNTVWSGIRWANPSPGQRIAVVGIGGLGHLAVQYSKAAGFTTIAVSRSPQKDAMIREFGADLIVRDGKQLAAEGGADIILATTNSSEAMADSMIGLRPDGKLMLIGFDTKQMPIDPGQFIFKRYQVIGSQQNTREHFYEQLQIAGSGKVKPMIETYPLNAALKAYDRVASGEVRFRAVLLP